MKLNTMYFFFLYLEVKIYKNGFNIIKTKPGTCKGHNF